MKKWVVFLLGSITGAILTIVVLVIIGMSMNNSTTEETTEYIPGLVMFEQPGDMFKTTSFEVMQVLSSNMALAHAEEDSYGLKTYTGTLVLLVGDENTHFYDDQIVEVPKGKVARHIGTYQYETKMEMYKTVPVIQIFDK